MILTLAQKTFRLLWQFTLDQANRALVTHRYQRALPYRQPLPALAKRPIEVRAVPIPPLSPTEQEAVQVAEQAASALSSLPPLPLPTAPIAEVQVIFDNQPAPVDPTHPNRGSLVEGLLDEAWGQGLRTYPQLIKYVELQTGTGCSRRAVARWKTSRQLTEVAV